MRAAQTLYFGIPNTGVVVRICSPGWQKSVFTFVDAVDADNISACLEQSTRKAEADETCGASDEDRFGPGCHLQGSLRYLRVRTPYADISEPSSDHVDRLVDITQIDHEGPSQRRLDTIKVESGMRSNGAPLDDSSVSLARMSRQR